MKRLIALFVALAALVPTLALACGWCDAASHCRHLAKNGTWCFSICDPYCQCTEGAGCIFQPQLIGPPEFTVNDPENATPEQLAFTASIRALGSRAAVEEWCAANPKCKFNDHDSAKDDEPLWGRLAIVYR